MDVFIENIINIKNEMNELKETMIFNNQLRHKQYLVYYLYRIFCKNYSVFELLTMTDQLYEVRELMRLPPKINKCVPLCGKIPNDLETINSILEKIITLFSNIGTVLKERSNLDADEKIIFLNGFVFSKKDISTIKTDLILLSSLLPNLNEIEKKPANKV